MSLDLASRDQRRRRASPRRSRLGLPHGHDLVPGIVERRPDQVVHGGVLDNEPARHPGLHVDHTGNQDARIGDQRPARFEGEPEPKIAGETERQGGVLLDGRRHLRAVAHADPAPEVEPLDDEAAPAQLQREVDKAPEGRHEGCQLRQLRADVDGKPDRLQARQARRAAIGVGCMREVDAELVLLLAGGDLGVGARIDVGIDAQRDRRGGTQLAGDDAQQLQLRNGFDIDLRDPLREREAELFARLADAREDDMSRRNARGERAPELALRNHVGARAELCQQPDHGLVRVGLDGVVNADVATRECRGEATIGAGDRGARIAVDGRPDRRGDARKRHVLDVELARAVSETGRGRAQLGGVVHVPGGG